MAALARGETQDRAAIEAGASARSVRRWTSLPAFASALRATRDEAFGSTVAALASAGLEAVAVLKAMLTDGSEPALRLRAAVAVLEIGARAQAADVTERVAELERRLGLGSVAP